MIVVSCRNAMGVTMAGWGLARPRPQVPCRRSAETRVAARPPPLLAARRSPSGPAVAVAVSRSQGIAPGSAVARWAMWRGRPGTPVPGRDREFCAEGGGLVTRSSPRHDDGRRRQVDRGPFLAVGVVGLERLRTGRW